MEDEELEQELELEAGKWRVRRSGFRSFYSTGSLPAVIRHKLPPSVTSKLPASYAKVPAPAASDGIREEPAPKSRLWRGSRLACCGLVLVGVIASAVIAAYGLPRTQHEARAPAAADGGARVQGEASISLDGAWDVKLGGFGIAHPPDDEFVCGMPGVTADPPACSDERVALQCCYPPKYPRGPSECGACPEIRLQGTVPGDIISDLQRARIVPEPYMNTNWVRNSTMYQWPWTYSRSFDVNDSWWADERAPFVLVLEGIKMGTACGL